MFNLNAFSTRVKKTLIYDNISKSKTDYYDSHNIFVNKKSMNLMLDGILSKDLDHNINKNLSVKNTYIGSNFSGFNIAKEDINFKKSIKGYSDYNVLFFRQTVETNMVLSQLHFYNGKLFYANTSFTYLGENEEFRRLILLELSHKYNLEIKEELSKDVVVEDINNNRLMIIDNGRIVLHYVCGDTDLINDFRNESGTDINEYKNNQEQLSLISNII